MPKNVVPAWRDATNAKPNSTAFGGVFSPQYKGDLNMTKLTTNQPNFKNSQVP